MILNELKDLILKKEKELKKIVEKLYGKNTAPIIDVSYKLKSNKALGTCQTKIKDNEYYELISLNKDLLKEYKELYINEVFVHEYAHACVHKYHIQTFKLHNVKRIISHGKEFNTFCRLFGIKPGATTDLFHSIGREKRWIYKCKCQTHELTTRRHNKIQNEGIKYICKSCGKKLKFKE